MASFCAIIQGHCKRWTGARNSAEQVTNTCLKGVLVAISIPIFTAQLEKAREATDLANIRSAYAEAAAEAITTDATTVTKTTSAKMQSDGAINKIASQNCGPWTSSQITIQKGYTATVKGTTTDSGATWTWELSGGASVSTQP